MNLKDKIQPLYLPLLEVKVKWGNAGQLLILFSFGTW